MTIAFRCPCGASYDLKDEYAGQILHCPRCGGASRVGEQFAELSSIGREMLAPESALRASTSRVPAAFEHRTPAGEIPVISDEMLAPAPGTTPAAPSDSRVDFEKGMSLAPQLTILLIVANVVIFIITLARGALDNKETIILAGALARERVLAGEVWRLVSSMFLHGGFDHLIGNCVVLYILGMACEHAYGLSRTGLLYFLAGICGALLSIATNPGPSVGASGAIFGLMGAAIVFFRRHRHHFMLRDNRVDIVLAAWALYSIATGFLEPYIDNAGHIGGVLGGAAIALALRPALLQHLPYAQT